MCLRFESASYVCLDCLVHVQFQARTTSPAVTRTATTGRCSATRAGASAGAWTNME